MSSICRDFVDSRQQSNELAKVQSEFSSSLSEIDSSNEKVHHSSQVFGTDVTSKTHFCELFANSLKVDQKTGFRINESRDHLFQSEIGVDQ